MSNIVIFGAGDIARLAHFYFTNDSKHEVVAFTVDTEFLKGSHFLGLPLVGFESIVEEFPPNKYLRPGVSVQDVSEWLYEVDHVQLNYGLKYNGVEIKPFGRIFWPRGPT